MKTIFFLPVFMGSLVLAGCSQSQSAKKETTSPKKQMAGKVGGTCEGCEAIFECPIPFEKLSWVDTLPDYHEQGPKMVISGIIYESDGKTPAKDVVLYVYHTDQAGLYTANSNEKGWGLRHGSTRGWMKTNDKGEYKFYTLKPAPYPGRRIPAHIHPVIKEPDKNEYWIDEFLFDDDPLLTAEERKKNEERGGNGVIKLEKGNGILYGERNIYLGKNTPNYPQANTTEIQPGQGYSWAQLTPHASFPGSYNFQLFNIRDTIWALHSKGPYFSTDGIKWSPSGLGNIIGNNAFLDYVWFKDALYGIGFLKGNIEQFVFRSSIFRTNDMKKWDTIAKESNLPQRFFYHPFVWDNKIWIMGGQDHIQGYDDLWNSDDAVHWKKVVDHLPFGKRDNSQIISFHNKLFILNNDVWSSTDAIHWNLETKNISNDEIFGYAPIVFDDQIWLLGCNRNGVFKSELLKSKDGKNWTAERAPWSPRGGATSCLFHGKVIMTGGKYGGPGIQGQTEFVYSNDVWQMEKK